MKNHTVFFCGILLLAMMTVFSRQVFADGGFQYWNTESVSWKAHEDWSLKVEEEFRFDTSGEGFYYQHSDPGVVYHGAADWVDFGVNYRFILEKDGDDWEYENRPHLNGTLKFQWKEFLFSDRSRFEYRDKEDGNDGWRYRNKLVVKLATKRTRFELQPYIAEELYLDFDAEKLTKSRLYGGVSFKIYKKLKGEVFYMWHAQRENGSWSDTNVLGTKLKLAF